VEATNRSRAQQICAPHRSPSGLSDRRQQTAAAARALQAGGRPFEPGTAHRPGVAGRALAYVGCRFLRKAAPKSGDRQLLPRMGSGSGDEPRGRPAPVTRKELRRTTEIEVRTRQSISAKKIVTPPVAKFAMSLTAACPCSDPSPACSASMSSNVSSAIRW
jgi:hypothetical protein